MAKTKPSMGLANAVLAPIHCNAEFFFSDTADFRRYVAGTSTNGRYGRYDNPSWRFVEKRLAALDCCDDALLFPSGMGALTAAALSLLKTGDVVVYLRNSYRNVTSLFEEVLGPMGIEAVAIDQSDVQQCSRALMNLRPKRCRAAFVEMPSNPHLYLIDLQRIRNVLGPEGILVVDSTIASPVFFKPAKFGADLCVHSCTKYLGGHGDLLAGSVSGPKGLIAKIRRIRDVTGSIPDPHAAFLLNRSLDTLEIRMRQLQETGMRVAQYLEAQPWVKRVYYTGLESHPHRALVKQYLTGHGGVVSFELNATRDQTSAFVDALKVPYMGTNFGSTHCLVEQCSVFTYYKLTEQEREKIGISDAFVRLSVGMEAADELIEDLAQAYRGAIQSGSPSVPNYQSERRDNVHLVQHS